MFTDQQMERRKASDDKTAVRIRHGGIHYSGGPQLKRRLAKGTDSSIEDSHDRDVYSHLGDINDKINNGEISEYNKIVSSGFIGSQIRQKPSNFR